MGDLVYESGYYYIVLFCHLIEFSRFNDLTRLVSSMIKALNV